jgi:catechol 2,3-dioxygenase-like lactoylglutathione lyase family enzyme
MHFQSVVINVANLEQSVDFYFDVFGFTVLTKADQIVAMSAPDSTALQVIVLREYGTSGRIGGARHTGIRALSLEARSIEELDQIGAQLRRRKAFVVRPERDDWVAVVGHDPDRLAVVAICGRGPESITYEHWNDLDELLYRVGE